MKIPAFNEKRFFENIINKSSRVVMICDADLSSFNAYISLFAKDGYAEVERRETVGNFFAALKKNKEGVFINYHEAVKELTVVTENNTAYFDFSSASGSVIVAPQITHIPLEDFGMSYVIRLSDGRFIIIDGGWDFPPDAERLYDFLKGSSVSEKPIIAAWIMTHAHCDHYHCFITFMDNYGDEVEIERMMFTFPEHDDTEHYPSVMKKNARVEDNSIYTNIPRMIERVEKCGALVYSPRSGQRYVIGDAVVDILAGIEDTIHRSKNVNATSLVMRMELGGQVIIWGGDAAFSEIRLAEKYGTYLKADILQVPHHGFQSGNAEAEIAAYRFIMPRVCLLPVSDFDAYTIFCTYRDGTRFLMRDIGVEEMISGKTERTLTLPYTPKIEGKRELERKYLKGRYSAGSDTWIFSELNTGNPEDFVFTILNTSNFPTTVWVELFFEDSTRAVRFIKAEVPKLAIKSFSVIGDEVDPDAIYFGYMSLKLRGVPENAAFAVRFTSETPIVVSHKNHKATYMSTYNS